MLIYLSYDRHYVAAEAARLRDALEHFVDGSVEVRASGDSDNVADSGARDRALINSAVAVAVVLGKGWEQALTAPAVATSAPSGWLRELAFALEHKGKTLVVALVGDAATPSLVPMPPNLSALAEAKAMRLRDEAWEADVDDLLRTIERTVASHRSLQIRTPAAGPRGPAARVAGFALVALGPPLAAAAAYGLALQFGWQSRAVYSMLATALLANLLLGWTSRRLSPRLEPGPLLAAGTAAGLLVLLLSDSLRGTLQLDPAGWFEVTIAPFVVAAAASSALGGLLCQRRLRGDEHYQQLHREELRRLVAWHPGVELAESNFWYVESGADTVIVFIHGIFSNSRDCWLHERKVKGKPYLQYWPALLGEDPAFKGIDIYMGGFFTALSAGDYGFHECASQLYESLRSPDLEGRPSVLSRDTILFVCHSTGGIVVRQMLVEHYAALRSKKIGLLLIASPSRGSLYASLLGSASTIFGLRLAQQLEREDAALGDLHVAFEDVLRDSNIYGREAYENRPLAPFIEKLVPRYSAAGYFRDPVALPGTNHFSTVKPDSLRHPAALLLRNFLRDFRECAAEAARKSHSPWIAVSRAVVQAPARPRRLAMATLVIVVGIVAGVVALQLSRRAPSAALPLMVLPFENGGEVTDDYLVHGVSDGVRVMLGSVGVKVLTAESSRLYGTGGAPYQEIIARRGALNVLSGRVQRVPSARPIRLRVTVALSQVEGGRAVVQWEESFERSFEELHSLEAHVAERVLEETGAVVDDRERARIAGNSARSSLAYEAFLRGEEAKAGADDESQSRAADAYREAIAIDPNYALAWAMLSKTQTYRFANHGVSAGATEALVAANKARELDPKLAEAYNALGFYHLLVRSELQAALQSYTLALQVDPTSVSALSGLAGIEQSMGRFEAAEKHLRQALERDLLSANGYRRLGLTLLYRRRPEEALSNFVQASRLRPGNLSLIQETMLAEIALGDLAGARELLRQTLRDPKQERAKVVAHMAEYYDLGWVLEPVEQRLLLHLPVSAFGGNTRTWAICRMQAAIAEGDEAAIISNARLAATEFAKQVAKVPDDVDARLYRAWALAHLGMTPEAVAEGEQAVAIFSLQRDAYRAPYLRHLLVRVYMAAGLRDKAVAELEGLLQVPYFVTRKWLRVDPSFAPLRGDPAFDGLVGAMRADPGPRI